MPVKTEKEIEIMREGGKILAHVLHELEKKAKAGVRLSDLDKFAEDYVRQNGATPSFKGYTPAGSVAPYPASICSSLNDEIVHGLPDDRMLRSGDILKIDCGVFYKGFHTDSAITVSVGGSSKRLEELIKVTQNTLERAIEITRPGITTGDLGNVIEESAKEFHFFVIKELAGHGVGKSLHEEPDVPNFGKPRQGATLKEGMTIAIEPMISEQKSGIALAGDGFTYKTTNGSNVAHFEHTVVITANGCEILTKL